MSVKRGIIGAERKGFCQVHPGTFTVFTRCLKTNTWRSVHADRSLWGEGRACQHDGLKRVTAAPNKNRNDPTSIKIPIKSSVGSKCGDVGRWVGQFFRLGLTGQCNGHS